MKRLIFAIVAALLVSASVQAMEINKYLSGSWYNPDQNGHGLSILALDENRTLIYWYVYDAEGSPTFLISVGDNQGNITEGNAYIQEGMRFGDFNPDDVQQKVWGTMSVSFDSCNSAVLEYSSNDPDYGSGVIPMQRLIGIQGMGCSENPLTGLYKIEATLLVGDEASGYLPSKASGYLLSNEAGALMYKVRGVDEFGENFTEYGFGSASVTDNSQFDYEFQYRFRNGERVTGVSGSGWHSQDIGLFFINDGGSYDADLVVAARTVTPLQGSYDVVSSGEKTGVTVTIDSNLNAVYQAESGCRLEGKVEYSNPGFNVFSFVLEPVESVCTDSANIVGTGFATLNGMTWYALYDNKPYTLILENK